MLKFSKVGKLKNGMKWRKIVHPANGNDSFYDLISCFLKKGVKQKRVAFSVGGPGDFTKTCCWQ